MILIYSEVTEIDIDCKIDIVSKKGFM